jgi:murein DD-endopeptidase MepM/ murein hydrolase activator NlpD
MQSISQRTGVGRHRKVNTAQTVKGRIALVTVAAGAVSTAGVGGATAAQVQTTPEDSTKTQTVDFKQVSQTSPLDQATGNFEDAVQGAQNQVDAAVATTPQILTVAETKPVQNLSEQLDTAIQASEARAAADEAARAPSVARPAEGAFTSGFGPRWGSFHSGIDIANSNGTPILSVMDGTVIDSGPASGYGNWIRIKHDDGSMSVYGHMESLDVAVGQRVTAGQKIAGMGSLGFSTGTHLHFEIHPDGNTAVDPIPWFQARGINIS